MSLLLLLLTALPATAGPACDHTDTVQSALMDPGGWSPAGGSEGVTVTRKEIEAIGLTAFKGETVLPATVDAETLFEVICDVQGHVNISGSLDESTLLAKADSVLHFYQVMAKAPLIDRRYWMVHSVVYEDIGGLTGHHRRTWDGLDAGLYGEARDAVKQRYDGAFEVIENHGSWEVQPRADGTTLFTYRAVTDPGGAIPTGAYDTLTSRKLPNNMMKFVEAAEAVDKAANQAAQ